MSDWDQLPKGWEPEDTVSILIPKDDSETGVIVHLTQERYLIKRRFYAGVREYVQDADNIAARRFSFNEADLVWEFIKKFNLQVTNATIDKP